MTSVEERANELSARRQPFVRATVVRVQAPTSAHTGDRAIVLSDGAIEGFVGGQCVAGSVRTVALQALESGEPLLLRVLPEGDVPYPTAPGALIAVNPCLSGGAIEVFLEPVLPSPICFVAGESPIAEAVAGLARQLDFEVRLAGDGASPEGALAAVIAEHGGDEPIAMYDAVRAAVPYIALVASPKRGEALLDDLGLEATERAAVHTPAGLDIGAKTPMEVAVSILAELIRAWRVDGLAVPRTAATTSDATTEPVHEHGGPERVGPAAHTGTDSNARSVSDSRSEASPQFAVDPVCGMTAVITGNTPHAVVDGEDVWFCGTGCRDHYVAEHGGLVTGGTA